MKKQDIDRIKARAADLAKEKRIKIETATKAAAATNSGGRPILTYNCGHKLPAMDCPQCLAERRKKKAAKNKASWSYTGMQCRLPEGSRFDVKYDASSVMWSGSLSIPLSEEETAKKGIEAILFSDSRSGVFQLLGSLDRMYREFLCESLR